MILIFVQALARYPTFVIQLHSNAYYSAQLIHKLILKLLPQLIDDAMLIALMDNIEIYLVFLVFKHVHYLHQHMLMIRLITV